MKAIIIIEDDFGEQTIIKEPKEGIGFSKREKEVIMLMCDLTLGYFQEEGLEGYVHKIKKKVSPTGGGKTT